MANIVAEIQAVQFDFSVFEGDDFLWERFLKEMDKDGNELDIPLNGYFAEFEVVDSDGVRVFLVNTAGTGYPAGDGITLGTTDGQITVYKLDLDTPGKHTYALRISVPDTNSTQVTIIYGTFEIREKIVTT